MLICVQSTHYEPFDVNISALSSTNNKPLRNDIIAGPTCNNLQLEIDKVLCYNRIVADLQLCLVLSAQLHQNLFLNEGKLIK